MLFQSLGVFAQGLPQTGIGFTGYPYDCYHFESYAPYNAIKHHTPLKYIHVNVHLLYKGDTTAIPDTSLQNQLQPRWEELMRRDTFRYGNLLNIYYPTRIQDVIKSQFENVPNSPINVDSFVWGIGDVYAHLDTSNLPNSITPHIEDSRIRFIVDSVYSHFNDSVHNLSYALSIQKPFELNFVKSYFDNFINNPPSGFNSNALNVVFLGQPGVGGVAWWNSGLSLTSSYSMWHKDYGIGRHEIGHLLGLDHTVKNGRTRDSIDDTPAYGPYPLNPECWNGPTCSNNMMDYNASQDVLSAWQIGAMHHELMRNPILFARKALQLDHCNYHPADSIVINTGDTITWAGKKWLWGDVIIKSGGKLTIKCEVSMPIGSRVIVQRGGSLVLDGGTLTNICGNIWRGIEVWGDATKPQNDPDQGMVVLQNGAVIQHAYTAISLIRWDLAVSNNTYQPNWQYTSGIVKALNSTFRNNARAIEFMSYHNMQNGNELRNLSYAKDCVFKIDSFLRDNGTPNAFITMYDVKKPAFQGNLFINSNTAYSQSGAGMGIYTELADLELDDSPVFGTNVFRNLNCAVRTVGFNASRQTIVRKNKFYNNIGGIHINASNYSMITEDSLQVPMNENGGLGWCGTPSGYANTYGLQFEHSKGFQAEGSDFTTYGAYTPVWDTSYFDIQNGIIVNNSGINAHQIYRNTFSDIMVGNKATSVNGAPSTGAAPVPPGLEFKCNEFDNDVYVTSIGVTQGSSVGYYQGSFVQQQPNNDKNPAGNEFRHVSSRFPNDNLVTLWYTEPNSILYIHHDTTNAPQLFPRKHQLLSVLTVQAPVAKGASSCPNLISGVVQGGGGGANRLANPFPVFIALRDSLVKLNDTIIQANADALANSIDTQSPADAYMQVSPFIPYLSDKVLLRVVANAYDTLAPEYYDLLLLHSPLSIAVWNEMAALPFTTAQADSLLAAQTSDPSPRENLLRHSNFIARQQDQLKDEEIRWWLSEDSIPWDNIQHMLMVCPHTESKFDLADVYISKGDHMAATQILDSIYDLNNEWRSLATLKRDLIMLYFQPGGILRAKEIPSIVSFAENMVASNVSGWGSAQALLDILYKRSRCTEPGRLMIPEDMPQPEERRGLTALSSRTQNSESIVLHPNPSYGELVIRINSKLDQKGVVSVMDLQGRVLCKKDDLGVNIDNKLELDFLSPGVYVIEVQAGKLNKVEKWIRQ